MKMGRFYKCFLVMSKSVPAFFGEKLVNHVDDENVLAYFSV
jgi:hypothetical protein